MSEGTIQRPTLIDLLQLTEGNESYGRTVVLVSEVGQKVPVWTRNALNYVFSNSQDSLPEIRLVQKDELQSVVNQTGRRLAAVLVFVDTEREILNNSVLDPNNEETQAVPNFWVSKKHFPDTEVPSVKQARLANGLESSISSKFSALQSVLLALAASSAGKYKRAQTGPRRPKNGNSRRPLN